MKAWNKGMKFPYKPNYKLRGRIPWNKNLTKEIDERVRKNAESGREKKRLSHLGTNHSEKTKINIGKSMKGKKKSDIHKIRISETLKRKYASGEIKKVHLGKHLSKETIEKLKNINKGHWKLNKNPKWKGGISFESYGVEWNEKLREQIRKRDNYKCQICNKKQEKKKLDVHHIDENKKNNKSRNLISLCHHCHVLIHNKKSTFFFE